MSTEASGESRRHWAVIGLTAVVLVVVNTWPLAPRLDEIGRADSYDGQYGLWQAAWVSRALVTDPLHLYDANIFYPHRTTLAFSEPTLLAGIIGLPAYLATGSPYATHNLAVLGFFAGDQPLLGVIAHNMPDMWLHVAIAVVTLWLGFGMRDEPAVTAS